MNSATVSLQKAKLALNYKSRGLTMQEPQEPKRALNSATVRLLGVGSYVSKLALNYVTVSSARVHSRGLTMREICFASTQYDFGAMLNRWLQWLLR